MKKRVLVVDEHTACRQMMARMLSTENGYEIVAEAEDGLSALELCRRHEPDLIILELVLPGLCGKEVLRRIRKEFPRIRLLVFSGTRNHALVVEALRLHPHGFVAKHDSLHTLLEALHAIASGRAYFSAFAASLMSEKPGSVRLALTQREMDVVQLVAESMTSKEIAARLGLATKTVENHRARIMEKLHIRDTAAMTRFAVRNGLVV